MNEPGQQLLVERRGPVEWITLNRPGQLNAITNAMAHELADCFVRLSDDTSVRVVVLRGAGRAFCAGLDIKETLAGGGRSGISRLSELVINIGRCPQPVIALVHGAACGGGFAFALAADVRIAGETARMNDAFIKLGVSGCELGLSYYLPRHVGTSVAAELMYTGRFINAQRALQVGLVSAVVPDQELEQAAGQLAEEMLRTAPLALRKTKETFRALLDVHDVATVIERERATQLECMEGPDFNEGLRAFAENRPPHFEGR